MSGSAVRLVFGGQAAEYCDVPVREVASRVKLRRVRLAPQTFTHNPSGHLPRSGHWDRTRRAYALRRSAPSTPPPPARLPTYLHTSPTTYLPAYLPAKVVRVSRAGEAQPELSRREL